MSIGCSQFNIIDDQLNALLKIKGGPGLNTLAPSLLTDDGSALKYNGVNVGGSPAPTTTFYVDSAFVGVSTGSLYQPFKTISAAFVAMTGAGPYAVVLAPNTYTDAVAIVGSIASITIYGNNSTWNVTSGVTINGPTVVYDLNTVGNVTYAYAGSAHSIRQGGSWNGTVNISGGYLQAINLNLTGTVNVTGTATPYFDGVTGGGRFVVNGASAVLFMNNCNLINNNAASNITVTSGQLIFKGGILVNNGLQANVVLSNTNTLATAHEFTQVACNYGVTTNSAYTIVAPDCVIPILTGTHLVFTGPRLLAGVNLAGQTANISATAACTAQSTGLYRVSLALRTEATGTGGVTATIAANNGFGAVSQTTASQALTALTNGINASYLVYVAAGQAINYSAAYTATGTYGLSLTVEQVQ